MSGYFRQSKQTYSRGGAKTVNNLGARGDNWAKAKDDDVFVFEDELHIVSSIRKRWGIQKKKIDEN